MMNSTNIHNENTTGIPKFTNSRRPLQRLSVNSSSSKSPCGKKALSTSKPKLTVALKPRMMDSQDKLLMVAENLSQWPSINETRTPSMDSEFEERPSIFRTRADISVDQQDMFALKRANPVYDSDDEDSMSALYSPSKRQRTNQALAWGNRLSENSGGYSLHL